MAFDNFYPNRKDRRRKYYDARRFSSGCRNHGSCGWCRGNRLYSSNKRITASLQQLKEYYERPIEMDLGIRIAKMDGKISNENYLDVAA